MFIFGRLLTQPQKINGSFLLPKYSKRVLASCTTSVYVNLSKNSFFCASRGRFLVSGCKGTHFFWTNQDFLRKTFDFNATFLRLLMQIKDKMYIHLYNIIYRKTYYDTIFFLQAIISVFLIFFQSEELALIILRFMDFVWSF